MLRIRAERESDHADVKGLLVLAFGRENEGKLVEALRKDEAFDEEVTLVAVVDRQLIGHVMFSQLKIESESGSVPALALAPLAVRPDFQNQGIGTLLVEEGIKAARGGGHRIVIVVGDPGFYSRFGFSPASPLGLKASLQVPPGAFMALELVPGALAGVRGTVVYPPAFQLV